jgi:hypothetical protein
MVVLCNAADCLKPAPTPRKELTLNSECPVPASKCLSSRQYVQRLSIYHCMSNPSMGNETKTHSVWFCRVSTRLWPASMSTLLTSTRSVPAISSACTAIVRIQWLDAWSGIHGDEAATQLRPRWCPHWRAHVTKFPACNTDCTAPHPAEQDVKAYTEGGTRPLLGVKRGTWLRRLLMGNSGCASSVMRSVYSAIDAWQLPSPSALHGAPGVLHCCSSICRSCRLDANVSRGMCGLATGST